MYENTSIANQSQSAAAALESKPLPEQQPEAEVLDRILPIQLKLSVGAPDDPMEHEADAMADKVMRMPETSFIQRRAAAHAPADYDDEFVRLKPLASQVTPFIQTKSKGASTISESVSSGIKSSMGSGSQMQGDTKSFMESRFGTNFSDVKIHTGDESIGLNRSLNAKAFTVSNNIYFNSGQYQPETDSGKHLLAHELTHVLQQGKTTSDMVQRFESEEHQQLGNEASYGRVYNLGTAASPFYLTHGDILALSGDVFGAYELFELAKNTKKTKENEGVGTRDEIIWALQDPRIWEMRSDKSTEPNPFKGQTDPRFTKGTGIYAGYDITQEVKDEVFAKYQRLGSKNAGHFASPQGRDASGNTIYDPNSAGGNYLGLHKIAIKKADMAGRADEGVDAALAYEAAAQHFLTDSFSAGHLRT